MFSTYLKNLLLNWTSRGVAMPAAPTNLHMSLHNGNPTGTGLVADVTTTVRVAGRISIANTSSWNAIGGTGETRETTNSILLDFGNSAGAVSGQVTHAALWDAASGGNCLEFTPLITPITVLTGTPVSVLIGNLKLRLP